MTTNASRDDRKRADDEVLWRSVSREELHTYYTETFPTFVDDLPEFITANGPKQYALALDEPHPIRNEAAPDRPFIRRQTWETTSEGKRASPHFMDFDDVVRFIQYPGRYDPLQSTSVGLVDPALLEKGDPLPEAVYYGLDYWERNWIILVDIDAKDVACERAAERVDSQEYGTTDELLAAASITDAAPAGYPYTFDDVERALEYGFEVADIFADDFVAEETLVVYTGQGTHVYLLDDDRDHRYDARSREVLIDLLEDRYEIPVDPVVTPDRQRVARLPYSLHADVCRIAQPIDSPRFDFRTEALPEGMQ